MASNLLVMVSNLTAMASQNKEKISGHLRERTHCI